MKVTLNWLKDFIDINLEPKELADKLTNIGFEVEEIIYQNKSLANVVCGKINKIEKHINADKLVTCSVDIGKDIQIVTGATNVKVGDLVPVALEGADLANGIKIKNSTIRGVESQGMFCSVEELGVTDYDGIIDGIMILDEGSKIGDKIENVLMLNDVIFDINITANRGDANSIIGIAREISAITNMPFKDEKFEYQTKDFETKDMLDIDVQDFSLAKRYMAHYIENVKIEKSPLWLKARLNAVGIKSINNIVDITNYVLVEYGQPMHAFDYDSIGGKKVVVRVAKKGESLAALNGNTYDLDSSMLCVCDENKPMVIAGIIGDTKSCTEDTSTKIVFECASFERSNVRHTSRKIGVRTDSAARFEKGVDTCFANLGMEKALTLISKLNAGDIALSSIDMKKEEISNKIVKVSLRRIEKLLGIKIEANHIVEILNNLSIKAEKNGDELTLSVPPYRYDIENYADVAEEYIRMVGYSVYDNLDKKLFEDSAVTVAESNKVIAAENKIKDYLCAYGFMETVNFSICNVLDRDKLNYKEQDKEYNMIPILNPISEDIGYVRTSMANTLLNNVSKNIKRKNKNFSLFESGRVYFAKSLPLEELPVEKNMLAFVSVCDSYDFYTFKGLMENVVGMFDCRYKIEYSTLPYLHCGISCDFVDYKTKTVFASFGMLNPKTAKAFAVPEKTLYAQVDVDFLSSLGAKKYNVKQLSKYPSVSRDLCVVVAESVTCNEIQNIVKKTCGSLIIKFEIFDIYRSKDMGENKKSIAFNFELQSFDRTLIDSEITEIYNNVLKALETKLGAKLK